MLKKVWNFQKILLSAVTMNIKARRVFFAGMIIYFVYYLLTSIDTGIIINKLGLFIVGLIIAALCINDVLKPGIKLYECIPVSNRFVVGNLLLLPLVIILLCIAALAVGGFGFAILLNIVLGCIFLFSGGKVNPYASSPDERTATAISPTLLDWRNYLFLLFVMVILYFGFSVITFIKRRTWRKIGYAAFLAAATALSYVLEHCLPAVPGVDHDFVDAFPLLKSADAILWGTGLFAVLLVPAAVKLANRLYRGRYGNA